MPNNEHPEQHEETHANCLGDEDEPGPLATVRETPHPVSAIDEIPGLVRDLYALVDRLEKLFRGRKLTLDGHLVGSLGVVLAAHLYGVKPLPESTPVHDAEVPDVTLVQIKATQRNSVGLRAEPHRLLVLKLDREGRAAEVYNGPGKPAWKAAGVLQKNGQRLISLQRLRALMQSVRPEDRLGQLRLES